jgi:hypothetical protein
VFNQGTAHNQLSPNICSIWVAYRRSSSAADEEGSIRFKIANIEELANIPWLALVHMACYNPDVTHSFVP